MRARGIPEATVARLTLYHRALVAFGDHGVATVSSEELATAAGVNSAKLRKDLSYVGSHGIRGVGYEVRPLLCHQAGSIGFRCARIREAEAHAAHRSMMRFRE